MQEEQILNKMSLSEQVRPIFLRVLGQVWQYFRYRFIMAQPFPLPRLLRRKRTVREAHHDLSRRVEERSADLSKENEELKQEIKELKAADEEKNRLEAQLQQAQKMEAIATLAGGLAHDFNNLLMGIQGNTSLMLLDVDSTHPHYGRLRSIEQQVESGSKLTAQLIGYARKGKYEVKPIDVNRLVQETADTFGRTRKEITIVKTLSEDLHPVEADQGQIEQVLLNLYVNAADAMPSSGNMTLGTRNVTLEDMKGKQYNPKPGNYVQLTVTDTGVGMDQKTMERIFEPFFTTKEIGRGTGLGLTSAYGIVKAHGGHIEVQSEKGHGSIFSIYLPASEKVVEKDTKGTRKILRGAGTVLLVDDEETVRQVGRDMLKALGYEVLTAISGKEAIELYEEKKDSISLVLLDMIMPGMGGGETYDILRGMNNDIKVILTSGYSMDSQAKEILGRGCSGFLQKPFGIHALSRHIKKALDKE